jgi:8-oxo-dGTP pyrophosphatase MutT (NUDIX family)
MDTQDKQKHRICPKYTPNIMILIVKERLRQILAQRQKHSIRDTSRLPAAVLVPIYLRQGQYHMLFIRRTETVKVHQGQISFPGGNREEHDKSLLDTALREGAEEIGLRPQDVEILGELDDEVTTTSNYIVSPFVAIIPWPYHFRRNRDEVAEIIALPVAALLEKGCRRRYNHPDDKTEDAYAYHCQGQIIWGATARILDKFLDIFTQAMAPPDET